jgi:excisionase family DNA binding protein
MTNLVKNSSFAIVDSEKLQQLIDKVNALIETNQPQQPTDTNELFTVESLADYLKATPQTVYRYVNAREIPFFKVGKFIRFRKAEIDVWLSGKAVKTAKEEAAQIRNKAKK